MMNCAGVNHECPLSFFYLAINSDKEKFTTLLKSTREQKQNHLVILTAMKLEILETLENKVW